MAGLTILRGLGAAVWVGLIVAAAAGFESQMPRIMSAINTLTATPGMPAGWYVSSGQWRADTRTAAALLRYVLSPEPSEPASPVAPVIGDLVPPPPLLAVTNRGTHLPSA